MSVNPDQPEAASPRPPRPNRHFTKAMRTSEPAGEPLDYPTTLLRYPSAAMFLLMREAFRLGQQRMEEADTPAEQMRFPHFSVLACLDEFGSASQREISDRLRLDPSDLVAFVDWLEEVGFVRRRRDERDRRRYAVDLTPAGRRALRTRARAAERLNAELFGALHPEERERLRMLLLKVLASRSAP
jgi:MarR family transcriptional regulator, lower aerobic nicotinate degradation pathway regulator